MIIDTELIKGMIIAGGGITLSEIQILEGWVGLAIKIVAFVVIVVHLFRTINNWNKKENTMRLDNGDNESGRGSEIDPKGEPEDDDDDN